MRWAEAVRARRPRPDGRDLILAVETSCDETAAAVVEGGVRVLSNVVSSQVSVHRRFGGVVPEVASRRHVEQVTAVMAAALEEAGVGPGDLSAVAVTYGPGLVGALLVGLMAAKTFAWAHRLPLIGVHHIAGHLFAHRLAGGPEPPWLALIVSGGHTELVYVPDPYTFEILGKTRDDAAGEAFDKIARAIGLPYPGGPQIDALAASGDPEAFAFPRTLLEDSLDFSFSGLKTAVLNALNGCRQQNETVRPEDVSASFQAAVVDVLVEKTVRAVRRYPGVPVIVAGGVAANRGLRQALDRRAREEGFTWLAPPLDLCTDNAAMIAAAAQLRWQRGWIHGLDLNAVANLQLTEWAEGHGVALCLGGEAPPVFRKSVM
ncbi:MAG: tRNA (adenosine(37)-N6)-threonylcarbamoyltransferase complex transferase subunit TsaD [Alicyclobacillaceae bacterium]|nr:tRNA (adenosine(37)-N6)-threonylcarbamoyltransferase complex transferase subunit TsaD [Alicyclobacillaceae bacterium]